MSDVFMNQFDTKDKQELINNEKKSNIIEKDLENYSMILSALKELDLDKHYD